DLNINKARQAVRHQYYKVTRSKTSSELHDSTQTARMWRRPALLVLYLAVVVTVTWIVELGFWWDTGYTSYQIVNPLRNLSVSQIRMLLEMRGIQYTALLEKSEIVNLLEHSEIFAKEVTTESRTPIEIVGKEDFYEQIYDENESLWLIEVVPGEGQYAGHRVLDDRSWHALVPKLQVLQVSSAVVSCQYDRRFCARQGWSHPQLVLILPPGRQASKLTTSRNLGRLPGREQIVFTSTTHLSVMSVLMWLFGQILSRIEVVQDAKQLEEIWLNVTQVDKEKVPRVVYISELLSPPLLIATLGLRLSTRIKLASFTVRKEEKEQRGDTEQEEVDTSWWTVFPMDSYLVNVLFRPMASLSHPRPSQDLGLEEGMERLIERLATPDLWLHPVIPTDYMKDLPMWRFDGWGNEEDLKSESETDVD
ncbi:E3 ubiquitin-protein ligase RNF103-like, partial [Homarus americanus]